MKKLGIEKQGFATKSILFAFVQCLTIVSGIIQTMILSRALSEVEYGTYSQGLLIVNFVIPFLLLGLTNAITFFSGQKDIDVNKYINTIISIIFFLGLIGLICINLFSVYIQNYFSNTLLFEIIPFVSCLPLLLNLISAYQALFVAENLAVNVAIRNSIVTILQIAIISIGVFVFHNIRVIFFLMILIDIVQIVLFAIIFNGKKYVIRIGFIDFKIAKKLFAYSIPLALSTAIGTLNIYMDKLLIGRMMNVEDFAMYTNMAKELPFSFIVASFTTILMPVFIRKHADSDDASVLHYWTKYLELGLCITWILVGTAIFSSRELLIFLYSEKYSRGIYIFIIYLFVDCCRFSYFGIILSTFGKNKIILLSSFISMLCNLLLNILLFKLLGIIGPAISSLLSIILMSIIQISYSCKLLCCKLSTVFNVKYICILLIEIVSVGFCVLYLTNIFDFGVYTRLFLNSVVMLGILIILNYKRLITLIKCINDLSING